MKKKVDTTTTWGVEATLNPKPVEPFAHFWAQVFRTMLLKSGSCLVRGSRGPSQIIGGCIRSAYVYCLLLPSKLWEGLSRASL